MHSRAGKTGPQRPSAPGRRLIAAVLLAALTAVLVAACGSSSSSSSSETTANTGSSETTASTGSSETTETSGVAEAGACGTVEPSEPEDAQNVLAGLPAEYKAEYGGITYPIQESAYADWKPSGSGPHTVGILWGPLTNPFETTSYEALKKNLEKDNIKVIAEAAATPDPTAQLQQYQSLLQQGAEIIATQPNSEAAFIPAIEAAGKEGVPTVEVTVTSKSPYAVDVAPNSFHAVAEATADVLKSIGGKGEALYVHGIRAVSSDQEAYGGFKAALEQCPEVKIAGEVEGEYNPPVAKNAVLQFLATHPGEISLVGVSANMGAAVIQAFEQAGRTVPPVVDLAAGNGSISYLAQNAGKGYKGVSITAGPTSVSDLTARVISRMLEGQGLKSKTVIWPTPVVDGTEAEKLANPSWTLDTPGVFENPPSTWLPESSLETLFTNP